MKLLYNPDERFNTVAELRTAQASDKPCELYRYHFPRPSRTQGHHRHPVYLQNKVYGKIKDPELMYVCGTCHDSLHDVIPWMLGEARKPLPMPGRKVQAEAARTVAWYKAMQDSGV